MRHVGATRLPRIQSTGIRANQASLKRRLTSKERIREHPAQSTFELAHIRPNALRDEEGDLFRQHVAFGGGLADQDRDASFESVATDATF